MFAKTGNALLKLLLVLALLAGGVYAALFALRETAIVAEVVRDVAVDAVPGSVEVKADKDLQALKIEGSGRVAKSDALDPQKKFKAGEVLLELDMTELDRELSERKREYDAELERIKTANEKNSELEVADQALKNLERLQELGRASVEDVNRAKRALADVQTKFALAALQKKKLEADFEEFKTGHALRRAKMQVLAPMDGMIQGAMVAQGTLVASGTTVATFYSNERVVLAKISEEDFAKVALGDEAKVRLISVPHREFDAKVSKILPFADEETRRFTLHLEVQADVSMLLPNATGEVTITTDLHKDVPVVPRRAISLGSTVLVVKNGRVESRPIEVGFRGLDFAEVTKGLEPGEQVIVEDLDLFRDGQRVKIAQAKR